MKCEGVCVGGLKTDRLKPIFHCDAKLLVLGPGAGSPIPTCWYLKTLNLRYPQRETPTQVSGI